MESKLPARISIMLYASDFSYFISVINLLHSPINNLSLILFTSVYRQVMILLNSNTDQEQRPKYVKFLAFTTVGFNASSTLDIQNICYQFECKFYIKPKLVTMGNHLLQKCGKAKSDKAIADDRFIGIGPYYRDILDKSQIQPNPAYNRGNIELNRLMCILKQNDIVFEDLVVQSKTLLAYDNYKWKSAESIFRGQTFFRNDWQFQYQQTKTSQKFINTNFINATYWLRQHKQLLKQICVYSNIEKSGMYRFFFCLEGKMPTQILIDSLIPVNNEKQYLFSSPKKGGGIWMILLQKALAKAFGSYLNICNMSTNQIISEMSGFPAPQLYVQDQKKFMIELIIEPQCSRYLKIGKQIRAKAIFAFWFSNQSQKNKYKQKIIIQIIQTNELKISTKNQNIKLFQFAVDNKIIVGSQGRSKNALIQMINLDGLQQKIHLYNNSKQKLQCNFVVQADENIFLSSPQDYSLQAFKAAKKQMVINQYQKYHESLSAVETPQYKLRFMWMGHRGVFCLKNKIETILSIKLIIKKQFKHQISFEDNLEKNEQQLRIKHNFHDFFMIIRSSNQQYGQFYQIKI